MKETLLMLLKTLLATLLIAALAGSIGPIYDALHPNQEQEGGEE